MRAVRMRCGRATFRTALGAIANGVLPAALIASVESLPSAVAVDTMHHGQRTDFDR